MKLSVVKKGKGRVKPKGCCWSLVGSFWAIPVP